jgi:DNA-binding CsgD family transcriptional regulator
MGNAYDQGVERCASDRIPGRTRRVKSQRVGWRDLRLISELVGEVGELGCDARAWQTHALGGLTRLLDAQVGLTIDVTGMDAPAGPMVVDPVDVGWTDADRGRFHDYLRTQVDDDPGARALFDRHKRVRFLTALREQLVDDRSWYAARAVSEQRRACSIDDFASSTVVTGPGTLQGFILYRRWGDDRFALRHRRILRLFHLWLVRRNRDSFNAAAPDALLAGLPPRVRQAAELLRSGDSMKEIAARMGISSHTVNDYTKLLYRHLGVSGRLQLVDRLSGAPSHGRLAMRADLR